MVKEEWRNRSIRSLTAWTPGLMRHPSSLVRATFRSDNAGPVTKRPTGDERVSDVTDRLDQKV
jgi:hypothetical protein